MSDEAARREVDLSAPPAPWDYNPSAWDQRVRVSLVAILGVIGSAYLALYQWGLIETVWDPFFGDGTHNVLTSEVSHTMTLWIRLPDAALGTLAYLGDILFALAGSTRRWQYRPWLVVLFGIDVIPLGIVSVILVVLQGTIVGYWCTICLATAVVSIVLIGLAYDEVWSSLLYLRAVWKRTSSVGDWVKVFLGNPSEAAHEAAMEILERARVRREKVRGA